MPGKKATATPKRASKPPTGAAPRPVIAKRKASEPEKEEPKRRPGRPATGRNSETRGVTLSFDDWAWVDDQGKGRSEVIAALIAEKRRRAAK